MNNAFDDTAKTRYRDYFERKGLRAIPQYEFFSRSRATDLFVECNESERQTLQGTVFDYFRLINAIEFKGNNDPLTTSDFNLIMMRAWGIGVVDKSLKHRKKSMKAYGMQTRLREDTWPYIDEFFRTYPEEMRKLPSMKETFKAIDEAEPAETEPVMSLSGEDEQLSTECKQPETPEDSA